MILAAVCGGEVRAAAVSPGECRSPHTHTLVSVTHSVVEKTRPKAPLLASDPAETEATLFNTISSEKEKKIFVLR